MSLLTMPKQNSEIPEYAISSKVMTAGALHLLVGVFKPQPILIKNDKNGS
jgi:hypothetical protein